MTSSKSEDLTFRVSVRVLEEQGYLEHYRELRLGEMRHLSRGGLTEDDYCKAAVSFFEKNMGAEFRRAGSGDAHRTVHYNSMNHEVAAVFSPLPTLSQALPPNKPFIESRRCEGCSEGYAARQENQRFCSDACRKSQRRKGSRAHG